MGFFDSFWAPESAIQQHVLQHSHILRKIEAELGLFWDDCFNVKLQIEFNGRAWLSLAWLANLWIFFSTILTPLYLGHFDRIWNALNYHIKYMILHHLSYATWEENLDLSHQLFEINKIWKKEKKMVFFILFFPIWKQKQ